MVLKNRLLVATALTTVVFNLESAFADPSAFKAFAEEIREKGAKSIAHKLAPTINKEIQDRTIRATPLVAKLRDGTEVPVVDRKTPLATLMVAKVVDSLAPGIVGDTAQAVANTPLLKNYIELKVNNALDRLTEKGIEKFLTDTEYLNSACSTKELAKKAVSSALHFYNADDVNVRVYKQIAKMDSNQDLKKDLDGKTSQTARLDKYYGPYIEMQIRQLIRGFIALGTDDVMNELTQIAVQKPLETALSDYGVKPVAFLSSGIGAAQLGPVGSVIGGALGGIGAEKAKDFALEAINTQRKVIVQNTANALAETLVPTTDFELVRPDQAIREELVEDEWVLMTAEKAPSASTYVKHAVTSFANKAAKVAQTTGAAVSKIGNKVGETFNPLPSKTLDKAFSDFSLDGSNVTSTSQIPAKKAWYKFW